VPQSQSRNTQSEVVAPTNGRAFGAIGGGSLHHRAKSTSEDSKQNNQQANKSNRSDNIPIDGTANTSTVPDLPSTNADGTKNFIDPETGNYTKDDPNLSATNADGTANFFNKKTGQFT
jgi:hypothetical protein